MYLNFNKDILKDIYQGENINGCNFDESGNVNYEYWIKRENSKFLLSL